MDLRAWLDELEKSHAAATPGLWKKDGTYVVRGHYNTSDTTHLAPTGSEADATLIVVAVNALPELTGALRAVLDLADNLEDAAKIYRNAPSDTHDAGARNAHMAIARRIRAAVTAATDTAR